MPADSADVQLLMFVSHFDRISSLRYFLGDSLWILLSASSWRIWRSILKRPCQYQRLAPITSVKFLL